MRGGLSGASDKSEEEKKAEQKKIEEEAGEEGLSSGAEGFAGHYSPLV